MGEGDAPVVLRVDSSISKNDKVPWRIIEREAILVDVGKGEVIHLNEVASEIWDAIDGKKTIKDIVNGVCGKFDIDEETTRRDVLEFTRMLLDKKLIVC